MEDKTMKHDAAIAILEKAYMDDEVKWEHHDSAGNTDKAELYSSRMHKLQHSITALRLLQEKG